MNFRKESDTSKLDELIIAYNEAIVNGVNPDQLVQLMSEIEKLRDSAKKLVLKK